MSEQLVEAVARGICEAAGFGPDSKSHHEDGNEFMWQDFRREARGALKAIDGLDCVVIHKGNLQDACPRCNAARTGDTQQFDDE